MKPHIVILSAFFTPFRSGAEACVEEVPPMLKDAYRFTIVTARLDSKLPKQELLDGDIPVIRVGLGIKFDKWLFPFLAPIAAAKQKPDAVHAVLESFAGLAMIFCRFFTSAKRLLTCQSTNTSLLVGTMHKHAHAITVLSTVLKERAATFGRTDVTQIPNGLHLSRFPAIEKEPNSIVFVGRLEQMKGIDILLRAFANVVCDVETSGPLVSTENTHLRIVGDGSLRSELEALSKELGIDNYVTFVGRVTPDQVYEEMAKAQIFCGLSRHEAFGNVFAEAQAAWCAVIGTNLEGIPDIVTDGKTGLLVPPENPEAAAAALKKLLHDEELCSLLAAAGRKSAVQYDWSSVSQQYAAVYASLVPSR